MPSWTRSKTVVASGAALTGAVTVSDTELIITGPTAIPAAQPATLAVRTNNTTGNLTMTNSMHGITTGQRIDLYWNGGQTYDVTVGTVSGTTVPLTTINTAILPVVNTLISVGIATQVLCSVVGNNLSALAASLVQFIGAKSSVGYVVFDASSTDDLEILLNAGDCYSWDLMTPNESNPLASFTITSAWCSHSDEAAAHAFPILVLTH